MNMHRLYRSPITHHAAVTLVVFVALARSGASARAFLKADPDCTILCSVESGNHKGAEQYLLDSNTDPNSPHYDALIPLESPMVTYYNDAEPLQRQQLGHKPSFWKIGEATGQITLAQSSPVQQNTNSTATKAGQKA